MSAHRFRIRHRLAARRSRFGCLFPAVLVMAACHHAPPPAPPPPEVSVLTVEPKTIPADFEYVGQAEASKRVEVRAQVSGVIIARPYVEGTDVHKGDVLFRIDPTPYEAALRSAQAQQADAEARFANAERNLNRLVPLLGEHAVAQKDVDDARTEEEQARAAVNNAKGAVVRAQRDYDNTFVRAEISGRAGRANLVLGALVSGPTDLLTTVEQVDPIYVNFSPSDQDVLAWRRGLADKSLIAAPGPMGVRATLADGSVYPIEGTLDFADLAVQENTGTLALRASFKNPQHTLLPGQFVRVSLLGMKRVGAILVPQRAVQQSIGGSFVYVVDSANKVSTRDVKGDTFVGGQWLISSGLTAGDRVVVDGIQKIMPGAPVRPVAYVPPPDTGRAARGDTVLTAPPGTALRIGTHD
ncbi:MAG TPA: efflux RND transporter periplasmic adaptor subunit [Gemmatimonadaceae bacterium]|nr:efflux RND transporter periplasmic adaptor subunit [Gemmatimonadaceae bacterium]